LHIKDVISFLIPWGGIDGALVPFSKFIQIADLTGGYGIMFIAVAVNALGLEGEFEVMIHLNRPPRILVEDPLRFSEGGTVEVMLKASDPDGDGLFYTWTQSSGVDLELDDPSAAQPSFTAADEGIAIFRLVVNDGMYDSESDEVQITVGPASVDDDTLESAVVPVYMYRNDGRLPRAFVAGDAVISGRGEEALRLLKTHDPGRVAVIRARKGILAPHSSPWVPFRPQQCQKPRHLPHRGS